LLNRIHSLLPEDKNEHLISIIPRIWLRKNNRFYRKYLLVLTNRNIYFLREKGLFDVKLKSKETLSLSSRGTQKSAPIIFCFCDLRWSL